MALSSTGHRHHCRMWPGRLGQNKKLGGLRLFCGEMFGFPLPDAEVVASRRVGLFLLGESQPLLYRGKDERCVNDVVTLASWHFFHDTTKHRAARPKDSAYTRRPRAMRTVTMLPATLSRVSVADFSSPFAFALVDWHAILVWLFRQLHLYSGF